MARRKPPGDRKLVQNEEAVSYFRNKGNQPSFSWKDVAPEEHAFAFTVAKATQVEVLSTIRQAVDDAIANGETVESFKAKLEPKLVALGWWGRKKEVDPLTGEIKDVQLGSPRRLDTIFWANTRTAYAAGAWERAQRTKAALPYFVYMLGPSEVHRPEHEQIAGTILPVDDDYWTEHFPPNGWGCKCWVSQITRAEQEQLLADPAKTYRDKAPDLGMRTYVNDRTGEVRTIPVGIDPGWESNPGRLRQRNLGRHIAGKLDDAPAELREVAIKDVISSPTFRRIQAGEAKGVAPVAVLRGDVAKAWEASSRTVLFSDDTAQKQRGQRTDDHPGSSSRGHPELTASDYLIVQTVLDHGSAVAGGRTGNQLIYTHKVDGKAWKAVVKRTGDGRELYLTSLHRILPRQYEKIRKGY